MDNKTQTTVVVGVRLPRHILSEVKQVARARGFLSVSEYIRSIIIAALTSSKMEVEGVG